MIKTPRGRKGGRKKIDESRGGMVTVPVSIFSDQAEWLEGQPNKSAAVREAIDLKMKVKHYILNAEPGEESKK